MESSLDAASLQALLLRLTVPDTNIVQQATEELSDFLENSACVAV